MTPLKLTTPTPESVAASRNDLLDQPNEWWAMLLHKAALHVTKQDKENVIAQATEGYEFYANETYTVHRRACGTGALGELVHLSIKRHDRAPVSDWRDKQEIKNQLCGEEAEGVELYPAESRVVDTSNQYHLWVFVNGPGLAGLGFQSGFRSEQQIGFSKQRKFP